ncbi:MULTISPECIES: hypothetical protein [Actinoplanes]|uniref:hypothetical protein n=1 Tax=Actinoplanes TaxID=1865 RepID=UPI0005F2B625|nr:MULTISPECIES: hypothetical protein [Actinoplanes]GLY01273.1 hypothetical protein Acsp01_16520 [Actinoplanes sp. NBRC 101535]
MRRLLLAVTAAAGVILLPAAPASAHAGDASDVSAYRTTITGISSPLDGLSVRVVQGGAGLELTNTSDRTIEVLGYHGEPYLEIRPDGAYENVNSPATYLNADTALPAGADATVAPSWRLISDDPTVRWHDERARWTEAGLPATTDPAQRTRLRDWAIPLRDQTRTFEIQGTLDYEPPPPTWAWWTGAALIAALGALLAHRWSGAVRPLALIAAFAPWGYALTRVLDGTGWSGVLMLAGAIAAGAVYRHPPFYLALSGFVVAAFAGFGSTDVFFAAVVPSAGPGWLARALVAVTIGAGAGLALTGVLRLRAATAPAPASREGLPEPSTASSA